MLTLQIWIAASLLFATFWALAGLLIGQPGPLRTHREARSARRAIEPHGEAA